MKTLSGLAFDWAMASIGKKTDNKTMDINSDSTLVFNFLFMLTDSDFEFFIIEMIVPSREKQIKSEQRCSHLHTSGEAIGICMEKRLVGW
jgi:hypothetical protein